MNFHVHLITRDGLRDNTLEGSIIIPDRKSRLNAAMSKLELSSKHTTSLCGELSSALTKQRGKKLYSQRMLSSLSLWLMEWGAL